MIERIEIKLDAQHNRLVCYTENFSRRNRKVFIRSSREKMVSIFVYDEYISVKENAKVTNFRDQFVDHLFNRAHDPLYW